MVADLVPWLRHAFGAQAVDLGGGDAGLDVGGDVVQHFGGQAAGLAHAGNALGVFDGDAAHGGNYPIRIHPLQAPGRGAGGRR